MNTKPLEKIGLTKTQIKVYLALSKLGQSTTTNIIKESQVPTSKVYSTLEKLIQKGLASYVIKSNKKHFSATSPENLKEILKEKKEKLQEQEQDISKLIPELKKLQSKKDDKISADIYEGLSGLKTIYEKILSTLSKGETQYIIGAPKIGNELLEGYILDWHKKRIKTGIECRYIYDSNVREYGKVRERMPLTDVRYLPNNMVSPVWIEIFGEYVAIGHIKGSNATIFLIKDKEISKSYLDYFNLIWKTSSP